MCCYCVPSQTLFVVLCRNLAIVSCQTERPLQMVSSCREKHSAGDMLSSSFSRSLSPQSLLCAGTYRPRRWASIWIHELSLKSCAADGIEAVYMVYRDTVVSTARLRRALILQLTLQLISGALAATPVAVNGHAPILDALLFPKWFILFFRDVDMSIQSSTQPSLLLHNELLRSSTYFGTSSSKIHTSRYILQEKKKRNEESKFNKSSTFFCPHYNVN